MRVKKTKKVNVQQERAMVRKGLYSFLRYKGHPVPKGVDDEFLADLADRYYFGAVQRDINGKLRARDRQYEVFRRLSNQGFLDLNSYADKLLGGSESSQGAAVRKKPRKHKRSVKRKFAKVDPDFYNSKEWRRVRFKVLKDNGGSCVLCGRTKRDHGVILHVDHIIPLSKDWSKRLDPNNLQVLCEDCNLGKSNLDVTDWR